mmetsp:Transcript_64962/g.188339  ORF Transcript_64962/g.188339 Transcript_64962/m.188339 type:complete len:231 (-) Transcript_64962:343-1035(-)
MAGVYPVHEHGGDKAHVFDEHVHGLHLRHCTPHVPHELPEHVALHRVVADGTSADGGVHALLEADAQVPCHSVHEHLVRLRTKLLQWAIPEHEAEVVLQIQAAQVCAERRGLLRERAPCAGDSPAHVCTAAGAGSLPREAQVSLVGEGKGAAGACEDDVNGILSPRTVHGQGNLPDVEPATSWLGEQGSCGDCEQISAKDRPPLFNGEGLHLRRAQSAGQRRVDHLADGR